MAKLLFVEDDGDLLANLFAWFEGRGHICDCASDGVAALSLIGENSYDCLILDINMPRMDGYELCGEIRRGLELAVPVIMLTARDDLDDRIYGLDVGADDYMVKPFSLRELEARITALLRRAERNVNPTLQFADLLMRPAEGTVMRAGQPIRLTPTGLRILEILMRNAPRIVKKGELEEMLWGDNPPSPSALRNHILELRQAVDRPFPIHLLQTVAGTGYRLHDGSK